MSCSKCRFVAGNSKTAFSVKNRFYPRSSGQAGKINTSPCWSLINPPKSPYAVLSRLLISSSGRSWKLPAPIATVSAFVKRRPQCCLFTPDFCKSVLCPGKVRDDELPSPWHHCLPLKGAAAAQPLASLQPPCRLFFFFAHG